jgi:hypothetical protein
LEIPTDFRITVRLGNMATVENSCRFRITSDSPLKPH